MKITNNVIKLECTKGSYAYAIIDNGVTLIDTSMPGRGEKILEELVSHGIKAKDIKQILLTHHDIDHIGNTVFLSEKSGCDTLISKADLPYALGEKKRDGIKKVIGALMKANVPQNIKTLDGIDFGSIRVISTPGHTQGHVCFVFQNVLFAGDLINTKNGKITPAPSLMTLDSEMLLESCRGMRLDGVEWICLAHGEPVKAEAWKLYDRDFLSARK